MDNRLFTARLAKTSESDSKEVARLVQSLCAIIGECASETDSVAIPGFGTFEGIKTLEHVTRDSVTGKQALVPPSITINFKPGSRLKKAVSKS